ncbi:hypothetical protein LSTR_LSTR012761 [Laodelphax striatellus]|uniref:Glutamine amidotransferase type-2 domain-containing protein n=1 Tax=Laodelphax striatellus TaxID=195883 RepID=A0A482X5H9_LAOST|nr:hypothetical protein LSTR_LSTR012761 [Laodelphax striatellus]
MVTKNESVKVTSCKVLKMCPMSSGDSWCLPNKDGLYDPVNERDACGVGFIVAIDGKRTHKIVRDAEKLALRMNHRGACACDNDTGDGAGVLTAIPHDFYAHELREQQNVELPSLGQYATGIVYEDKTNSEQSEATFAQLANECNLNILCWRTVPTHRDGIGEVARNSEPFMRQVFVVPREGANLDEESLKRQVFILRKRATHTIPKPGVRFYICSLSHTIVVYKGQLTSDQLWTYFTDLKSPQFETYLALVHTRFSTNTFPSWERAHPLRYLAHNGEINTLRGNVNFMKAREGVMKSPYIENEELKKLYPVVEPNLSDSGSLDCVLEFLVNAGGRSLPEAVMTMVPEAWQNDATMAAEKRDFYHWAACAMEPWTGPLCSPSPTEDTLVLYLTERFITCVCYSATVRMLSVRTLFLKWPAVLETKECSIQVSLIRCSMRIIVRQWKEEYQRLWLRWEFQRCSPTKELKSSKPLEYQRKLSKNVSSRNLVCLGFDVVVAALLGADEFGMSTAPLIVMGCTMMRKCHLNVCPVGIATQDPVLREKFAGKPEHVINYLFMLAEEVREHMASLGISKFQDLVGRTDLLRPAENVKNFKAKTLNLSPILRNALHMRPGVNIVGGSERQDFQLEKRLDNQLIAAATPVINGEQKSINVEFTINNECRAFGSTLSYAISMKYGDNGLPEHSINVALKGSAGQSFCAFLARGVHVTLEGDANDYVGKGLSGGEVVIYPPKSSPFQSDGNVIVGNVCLYGATSGKAFFRGIAAERFSVRNSGAVAVVEGVGDHGCEYMTGGCAVILGLTGRNFAAGMSGGIAYVLDVDGSFKSKCNMEMVELLALDQAEDIEYVKQLLEEFQTKTGSEIAMGLLGNWPDAAKQFVKVFPYEYKRALRQMAEEKANATVQNNTAVTASVPPQSSIRDIEETVTDTGVEKKRLEKILDKTRGFVKSQRETAPCRLAEKRMKDSSNNYNFAHVRKGLRVQAARCQNTIC